MTERGSALAISTAAAVVAALPAVPRVGDAGASAAFGFLALWGGTALVLGPSVMFSSAARSGAASLRAPFLGLALAAAPLAALAEVLKQGTHHRPLGAATYSVLALGVVAGALLVAWRLLRFAESGSLALKRGVLWLTLLAAIASVGVVLVRALGSAALLPHVLDGLRALAAAAFAHVLLRVPRVAAVAERAGAPLWLAVVVAGFVADRGATAAAVRSAAPVLGGPPAWF